MGKKRGVALWYPCPDREKSGTYQEGFGRMQGSSGHVIDRREKVKCISDGESQMWPRPLNRGGVESWLWLPSCGYVLLVSETQTWLFLHVILNFTGSFPPTHSTPAPCLTKFREAFCSVKFPGIICLIQMCTVTWGKASDFMNYMWWPNVPIYISWGYYHRSQL